MSIDSLKIKFFFMKKHNQRQKIKVWINTVYYLID